MSEDHISLEAIAVAGIKFKKKKYKKTIWEKIINGLTLIFEAMRVGFKFIAWTAIMIVAIERILPFIKTTWGACVFVIVLFFGGLWWVVREVWS